MSFYHPVSQLNNQELRNGELRCATIRHVPALLWPEWTGRVQEPYNFAFDAAFQEVIVRFIEYVSKENCSVIIVIYLLPERRFLWVHERQR